MDIRLLYDLFLSHPEVTTDTRRCTPGSLFFALKGTSFDGNLFAPKAISEGCAAVVVDDPTVIPQGDDRYFLVPDVLNSLQQLAAHHRQQFKAPVLQITGTNGKTTTKELLAAVLSQRYNVLYTQGNLNNHIGVPLTLLRLRPGEHNMAIIETGANHPGEIAFLTNIVQPDYGLITNVGRAHLEGFGSFDGVKKTKGELYDYIATKPTAKIFINSSNDDLTAMVRERGLDSQRCISYGHQCAAIPTIVTGQVEASDPTVKIAWQDNKGTAYEVQTQLVGDYNLDNILAAVATGIHFDVKPEAINQALTDYHPSLGRSEYRKTADNTLIVDAYNANPSSMKAALANFSSISHPHKRVILGDMRELGQDSDAAHLQVIEQLAHCHLEAAWLVGEYFAKAIATLPAPATMMLRTFPNVEAVKEALASEKPKGACILIKGSNGTRLFQLPELL